MPPSKPNSAPEAPTEIPDCMNKADSKLPPKPDIKYSNPIRTAKEKAGYKLQSETVTQNFYLSVNSSPTYLLCFFQSINVTNTS